MSKGWRVRGRGLILLNTAAVLTFGLAANPGTTAGAADATVPTVAIGSASVMASTKSALMMSLPVTLSAPAASPVTVAFATQTGTAKPGVSFVAKSGTITFGVNPSTGLTAVQKFVPVTIRKTSLPCATRVFSMRLTKPVGATISNPVGAGTIRACVPSNATRAAVGDMRVYDGTSGSGRSAFVPIVLSRPAPKPVTLHYAIKGVSAVRSTHFHAPTSGIVKIGAKHSGATLSVLIVSGSVLQSSKSLTIKLTSATGALIVRSTGTVTIAAERQKYLFDDEFDGVGLDTSKWQPNWLGPSNATITKPVNSAERSCMDPAQVTQPGDGYLHLTGETRACTANNGITYDYASALVQTKPHFNFLYGYMEARMWLPSVNGVTSNWPAFWAAGMGVWPYTGEIDVMEGLHGKDCFHFHSSTTGAGGCAPLSVPSGWHTFGARWSAGSITYFYDGAQVGQITSGVTNVAMYLILQLGIGGEGGAITLPATVLVDYVRVSP